MQEGQAFFAGTRPETLRRGNDPHHHRTLHRREGHGLRRCVPGGLHLRQERGLGDALHPPGRVHRLRPLYRRLPGASHLYDGRSARQVEGFHRQELRALRFHRPLSGPAPPAGIGRRPPGAVVYRREPLTTAKTTKARPDVPPFPPCHVRPGNRNGGMANPRDSFYNVSAEHSSFCFDHHRREARESQGRRACPDAPGAAVDGRRSIPLEYKDYYETLKVKKDASQEEIQKAYRKLARKFHPDVNKNPGSEGRFKEIGEAYEVLKDPEKRKKYDQFGAAWKQSGGIPPEWQGFDFGGMGGTGRPGGAGGFDFQDLGGGGGVSSFFEVVFGGGRG